LATNRVAPKPRSPEAESGSLTKHLEIVDWSRAAWVESGGGAVMVAPTRRLPPLSAGGASIGGARSRFHIPLIEPGVPN